MCRIWRFPVSGTVPDKRTGSCKAFSNMPPKKRTLLTTTRRAKRYKERQSRKEQNDPPESHRRRSRSDIARKQTDDQRSIMKQDRCSSTESAKDPAAHSTTQEHTQRYVGHGGHSSSLSPRTDDATPPTETGIISTPPNETEIISTPPTETSRETQRLARDHRPTAYRSIASRFQLFAIVEYIFPRSRHCHT